MSDSFNIEKKIRIVQTIFSSSLGKGGQTVHEMSHISKTRIMVDRADPRSKAEKRLITITGTPEAISNAKVRSTLFFNKDFSICSETIELFASVNYSWSKDKWSV